VAKCQLRAAPRQADKDRRREYNSKRKAAVRVWRLGSCRRGCFWIILPLRGVPCKLCPCLYQHALCFLMVCCIFVLLDLFNSDLAIPPWQEERAKDAKRKRASRQKKKQAAAWPLLPSCFAVALPSRLSRAGRSSATCTQLLSPLAWPRLRQRRRPTQPRRAADKGGELKLLQLKFSCSVAGCSCSLPPQRFRML